MKKTNIISNAVSYIFRSSMFFIVLLTVFSLSQAEAVDSLSKAETIENLSLEEAENISENWTYWEKIFTDTKGWKLLKDKNGIKCYGRPLDFSDFNSFKGVTEVEADFESVIAVFNDFNNFTSWMLMVDHIEMLKQKNENEAWVYYINRPFWPVRPRDCTGILKWFYNPKEGTVILRLKNNKDYVPLNEEFIRIQIMMGYYRLTPKPNGKVEIVSEVIVDVGGFVPAWILNWYSKQIPYITFTKLKKQLILEKYKGVHINYKDNFAKVE